MDAKNLVQTLRYNCNLKVEDISNELNVNKVTIYNWVSGSEPSDKNVKNLLKELIRRNHCDIEYAIHETKEILDKINKIKNEVWKDLILGLQEKLNLEQFELLKEVKLKKDFHISEWINGKRIPTVSKKFKFLQLIKKHKLKPNNLITLGRKVRKSIKVNNKWVLVKEAIEFKNTDRKTILVNFGKNIYLNPFSLFPTHRGKNSIKFIDKGDKIIVFYDEKISTRPHPLILPKLIDLNNDFLLGLGIYIGEGSRNRKPKVTNSESLIINQAIKFFNFFGVSKHQLSAWIQLHERSLKGFDEVKDFWIKNTFIEKENLRELRVKKSCGNAPVKQHGVLHVEANFILLQFLIEKLVAIIPHLMANLPNEKTVPFLQGLFAAEGSVSIAKSGSLREIRYTSKRDDERNLVKELLEKQGIVVHEYKKGFDLRMYGFDNLKKLVEIDLFKYHLERDRKFKEGFKKLKISKKLTNF